MRDADQPDPRKPGRPLTGEPDVSVKLTFGREGDDDASSDPVRFTYTLEDMREVTGLLMPMRLS